MLVQHKGHLVTREELLASVWGPEAASKTQYLRVHMASIRQKVEPDPSRPRYFVTVPGPRAALRSRRWRHVARAAGPGDGGVDAPVPGGVTDGGGRRGQLATGSAPSWLRSGSRRIWPVLAS